MKILYITDVCEIGRILVSEATRKNIEAYIVNYPWSVSRISNFFDFLSFIMNHHSVLEFDIYHYNWPITTLLPRNRDVVYLKRHDNKVFLHYHGDDIRGKKERDVLKNVDGKFISTPDLQSFIPDAEWIPFPYNLRGMKERKGWNDTIRIVHAPSDKSRKGTIHILRAIKELKKRYTIDFELIEKKPNIYVLERLAASDIVIDQIGPGWYGKVTLEAVYSGAVPCFYVRDDLSSLLPDFYVPITEENITEKIGEIIEHEGLRDKLRAKGYEYLKEYHDSEKVMETLLKRYGQ
ncbi:MAG: glycosyltransferase family 1 protein [Theionarchaea archaeon]|nr:MAG: hypothetical protein AYK19_00335 [Theionarchaea archaeon DG-70-1]MBU7025619.1 glycosyltransferase family 1 protein [Theionarchaea archaeon]